MRSTFVTAELSTRGLYSPLAKYRIFGPSSKNGNLGDKRALGIVQFFNYIVALSYIKI
jgi:hypothetical protein